MPQGTKAGKSKKTKKLKVYNQAKKRKKFQIWNLQAHK